MSEDLKALVAELRARSENVDDCRKLIGNPRLGSHTIYARAADALERITAREPSEEAVISARDYLAAHVINMQGAQTIGHLKAAIARAYRIDAPRQSSAAPADQPKGGDEPDQRPSTEPLTVDTTPGATNAVTGGAPVPVDVEAVRAKLLSARVIEDRDTDYEDRDPYCPPINIEAAALLRRLSADLADARKVNLQSIVQIGRLAREAGEAKGKLEASELPGVVDMWREQNTILHAKLSTALADASAARSDLDALKTKAGEMKTALAWLNSACLDWLPGYSNMRVREAVAAALVEG